MVLDEDDDVVFWQARRMQGGAGVAKQEGFQKDSAVGFIGLASVHPSVEFSCFLLVE